MSYVPMIICWSLIMQAQLWQGRVLQTPFFGPNTACYSQYFIAFQVPKCETLRSKERNTPDDHDYQC